MLAAADYLAAQPFVDPHRIYLGGHSTGGTLALLCAECGGTRFRAVFAFGPVDDLRHGNRQQLVFDQTNPKEWELRAPGRWLGDIRVPTFVFEGDAANANGDLLTLMARANRNPAVQFLLLRGADHFEKLQPVSRLIAAKILADTGPSAALSFEDKELNPSRASTLSPPGVRAPPLLVPPPGH